MPIPKLKQPKPKLQRLLWSPSENIKRQISVWEGDAMHKSTIDPLTGKMVSKNASFEDVTKDFIQSIPVDIRDLVLSNQDLADYLYSFRYNVKPDTFKSRVIPVLSKYYAGQASVDDLVGSIWASGDKKLRGLLDRRSVEKNGIRRALIGDLADMPNEFERTTAEIPSYQRPLFNTAVLKVPAVNAQYNKQPHQGVSPYIDNNQGITNNQIAIPWEFIEQNTPNFMPPLDQLLTGFSGGKSGIHIKPSTRGTFTAAAKSRGMGVQQFASKVLSNPNNYSSAMRKKAQFAHNAAGWKH